MSMQLKLGAKTVFTPKEVVSETIDKKNLSLYPTRKIGEDWSELEHNLAFHINVQALETHLKNKSTILSTLAERTQATSGVNTALEEYKQRIRGCLVDPSKLRVLSYHDRSGKVIYDAAIRDTDGLYQLKPIEDRPLGIYFVKFVCTFDFSEVTSYKQAQKAQIDLSANDTIEFYHKMPEMQGGGNWNAIADDTDGIPSRDDIATLIAAETAAGSAYADAYDPEDEANLETLRPLGETFEAAKDACDKARDKRKDFIKKLQRQACLVESGWFSPTMTSSAFKEVLYYRRNPPAKLTAPSFDSVEATLNTDMLADDIDRIVLDHAYEPLKLQMFSHVCPDLKNEPFQLFNSIKQTSIDPNDTTKTINMGVGTYSDVFMSMMRSLPTSNEWTVDVHSIFVMNLALEIRQKMETDGYTKHHNQSDRHPRIQLELIQEARNVALKAEKALDNQVELIQNQINSAHGFSAAPAGVMYSPAEKTISHYKNSNEPATPARGTCWGCGKQGHRWFDPKSKKVVCPQGQDPNHIKNAEKMREKFVDNKKTSRKNKQKLQLANAILDQAKTNGGKSITINLSSPEPPAKKAKTDGTKVFNFLSIVADVFHSGKNGKSPLPIRIQPNLPHIKLVLGQPDAKFQAAVLAMVDSGAALSIGYSEYVLGICKEYPHLVKSIVWAGDTHIPIDLSGVVADEEEKKSNPNLSTQLTATVTFYLPYFTKNNEVTELTVAISKHVAVNLILGITFIESSELVLDLKDKVAEAKMLDTEPFEVVMKPAGRSLPNKISPEFVPDNNVLHSAILQKIEETRKFLDGAYVHNATDAGNGAESKAISDTEISGNTSGNNKRKKSTIADEPIVVQKHRYTKKKRPNLFKDMNITDDMEGFDFLFEKQYGKTVSKSTKKMRDANDIHPAFQIKYDEKLHGEELRSRVRFPDKIDPIAKEKILNLIKEYWCCFMKDNVQIPIRDYQCHIDTGDAKPFVEKNLRFGMHETPIMDEAIDALLQKDQIEPDAESEWMSKPVLAPKPHQENITGSQIDEFVWRFCINYIGLNQRTKVISYPIPRCDDAVLQYIGNAKYRISLDAFSGYHQIALSEQAKLRTAFAAPHGRKFRYKVMPFGVVNGPVIFVVMIYDLKGHWDYYAIEELRLQLTRTNSVIIIDDTFLYSNLLESILIYFRAILEISKRYCLSWKLEKCGFLEPRFEFVGIDVADEGNHPAKSKLPLFEMWKRKEITYMRDFSSFIGLIGFYRNWIPYFEEKLRHTREYMKTHDYSYRIPPGEVPQAVSNEMQALLDELMKDPVLKRPDASKRFYLRTDASGRGHGNCLLQPGDDEASLAAMRREIAGGQCEFDTTVNCILRLFVLGFAGRKCTLAESYLHSFMNEALSIIFAIEKWRVFLWGREFTILTDCRALIWLLSYEGNNAAVRRLQFEILGFWFTIWHRPEYANADADALSRVGVTFQTNPALENYYHIAESLRKKYPCVEGEITPDKLPGYRRKKRVTFNDKEQVASSTKANYAFHVQTNLAIALHNVTTSTSIRNIPVNVFHAPDANPTHKFNSCASLHHRQAVLHAIRASEFTWIVCNLGAGTFFSVMQEKHLPFKIVLASDPTFIGRSLIQELGKVPKVVDGSRPLLAEIEQDNSLQVDAYFATMPNCVMDESETLSFFQIQAKILQVLQEKHQTVLFIMQLHKYTHKVHLATFVASMKRSQWIISEQNISFPEYHDAIDDELKFITGVSLPRVGPDHCEKLVFIPPPSRDIRVNIKDALLAEYNLPRYALMQLPSEIVDEPFHCNGFTITPMQEEERNVLQSHIPFRFNYTSKEATTSLLGAKIIDTHYPAPPLEEQNMNPFQSLFGIIFQYEKRLYVRCISRFEYGTCFGLNKTYNLKLCQDPMLFSALNGGCPGKTMETILSTSLSRLLSLRDASMTIDAYDSTDTNQPLSITAPAATCFNVLNGFTTIKLPTRAQWKKAYEEDKDCVAILHMINNPSLITKKRLEDVHFRFRQPLRDSCIVLEEDMLYIREKMDNDSYIKLRIVPLALRNVIFLAFHSNPLGGHFSVYYTFHRIRMRFFWPKMYNDINFWCKRCAGCGLSNSVHGKSKELVYSFPVDAPFKVVVIDIYKAGDTTAFDGEKALLILLDHMSNYAVVEELKELNSSSCAKTLMKILLQHGFCHTVVMDADSKFKGIFKEVVNILDLNHHMSSGNNHDAILVERFNRYLNKSLMIFCSGRDSVRTFVEGAQMAAYAWNSAPMIGTDISRSLVVMGREYAFPIDYKDMPSQPLHQSSESKLKYHETLVRLLSACQEVYKVLIEEHRMMHREIANLRRGDPIVFQPGDYVWARRQILSNKSRGIVGKLKFQQTGPWKITKKLQGGSYELEHCKNNKRVDKKKATELSLYPRQLIPFPPLSGADNSYSQLHRKFDNDPYKEASIRGYDGYELAQPWQLKTSDGKVNLAQYLPSAQQQILPFPTLQELNDELTSPQSPCNETVTNPLRGGSEEVLANSFAVQQASQNNLIGPDQPIEMEEFNVRKAEEPYAELLKPATIELLIEKIIKSEDKLFFIRYHIPTLNRYEWRLAQVNFEQSMKINASCIRTARMLMKFFIAHPKDSEFNHPNQRFWKEYHKCTDSSKISSNYHLVRPNDDEEIYCKQQKLSAFEDWINLFDNDVFLLGPIDFGTINGRKTRDRISLHHWEALASMKDKYNNDAPKLINAQHAGYFCHIDTPYHSIHTSESVSHAVVNTLSHRYYYDD